MKRRSKLFAAAKLLYICRKPSHIKVLSNNLFRLDKDIKSDENHLQSAMEWLCRAQDATGCGGVSAAYSLTQGWRPPFPEATGYIIPTFLRYASLQHNGAYVERAIRMGDWEIEIQLPSGAVRGGVGINEDPLVFDTGQVIFGWTSLFRETGQTQYLDAASRAADWLVSTQDQDGKWSQHTYEGIPHTYHTRVAWSLLEIFRCTNDEKYKKAAEKNIEWTLAQATETGWFRYMGFTVDEISLTHTIAYTLRGLMESSPYLANGDKQKIIDMVKRASGIIIEKYKLSQYRGSPFGPMFLPTYLDERWESQDLHTSPVGNAQFSILWLKLFQTTGEARFLNAALKLIDQIKAIQSLGGKNSSVRGGIAGSYPIWGRYISYGYPNWGAKFFVDALMLKEETKRMGSSSRDKRESPGW